MTYQGYPSTRLPQQVRTKVRKVGGLWKKQQVPVLLSALLSWLDCLQDTPSPDLPVSGSSLQGIHVTGWFSDQTLDYLIQYHWTCVREQYVAAHKCAGLWSVLILLPRHEPSWAGVITQFLQLCCGSNEQLWGWLSVNRYLQGYFLWNCGWESHRGRLCVP